MPESQGSLLGKGKFRRFLSAANGAGSSCRRRPACHRYASTNRGYSSDRDQSRTRIRSSTDVVMAVPNRLRQAILSVVSNAPKFSGDGAHIRCAPDGCQRPGGDNGYRSWPGNRCRRSSVRVRSVQPDGRKEHTTTPRVRVGTQRRPPLEELVSEAELAWKHGDAVAGKAAAREARDSGREW